MPVERSALARCVGDPDRFASESWGRSAMVRRGGDPFRDLLDVDVVERLLAAPARRPMVRLVRAGAPVPASSYSTSVRLGGILVDDVVDVSRVMQLVADGATVVLQSMQHSWPPIARFCGELQSEIGHSVQANCYLTPPGSTALARHRDAHEVLVLQVEGSKVWTVEDLGEIELDPGDVLYIPRGTWHEAAAQERLSLHLTIGVLATTCRAALHRALDDVAGLDRPLPLAFATRADRSDAAREQLAVALRQVTADVRPDVVVDREAQRARSTQRVLPAGHLRTVLGDVEIDDATTIQADPRLVVTSDGDELILAVGNRHVRVPSRIRGAVAAVSAGSPVAVGALVQLDAGSRAVFAQRLVRESLASVVDPHAPISSPGARPDRPRSSWRDRVRQ